MNKEYMRTRIKMKLFSLVHAEFAVSNKSIKDLAVALEMTEDKVNEILASPKYWNLNIVSDFLMAISNKELIYQTKLVEFRVERNLPETQTKAKKASVMVLVPKNKG